LTAGDKSIAVLPFLALAKNMTRSTPPTQALLFQMKLDGNES
jgi:hypothetical protein